MVGFYGITTLVGYLMLDSELAEVSCILEGGLDGMFCLFNFI